jgi:hypothetical protein
MDVLQKCPECKKTWSDKYSFGCPYCWPASIKANVPRGFWQYVWFALKAIGKACITFDDDSDNTLGDWLMFYGGIGCIIAALYILFHFLTKYW